MYLRSNPGAFGGVRFEGEWHQGNRVGKMRVQVKSGDVLDAEYDGENWDGSGTVKLSTGETYAGQFSNGFYSGQGKLQLSNGDVFIGEFEAGLCKRGNLLSTNGDSFEGEFNEGRCWTGVHRDSEGVSTEYRGGEKVGQNQNIRLPDDTSQYEEDFFPLSSGGPNANTSNQREIGDSKGFTESEPPRDVEGEVTSALPSEPKKFETMELNILSIELAGAALKNEDFDEIVCVVEINGTAHTSPSSSTEEARSDKRLILTDFKGIHIAASDFENSSAGFRVVSVYDETLLSGSGPLYEFMHPVKEIFEATLPLVFEGGAILAVFKCISSPPKDEVRTRFRNMDAKDLVGIKFAPLLSSSQEEGSERNIITRDDVLEVDKERRSEDQAENTPLDLSPFSPEPTMTWTKRSVRVKSLGIKRLLDAEPASALCKITLLPRKDARGDAMGKSAIVILTFGVLSNEFVSSDKEEKGLWTSQGPDPLFEFDVTPKLLKMVDLEVTVQKEENRAVLYSGSMSLSPLIKMEANKEIPIVGELRDGRSRIAASAIAIIVMADAAESPRAPPRLAEHRRDEEQFENIAAIEEIPNPPEAPASPELESSVAAVHTNAIDIQGDKDGVDGGLPAIDVEKKLPEDPADEQYADDYEEDAYEDDFENAEVNHERQEIDVENVVNSERIALFEFQFASGSLWGRDQPLSQMKGVVTDASGMHVVELNLGRKNLIGHLPSSLSCLRHLTVLSLYGNMIEGAIPEELFELVNLRRLNLYDNKLSGSLSPSFSKLSALEILNVSGNQFSGPIPKELAIPTLKELLLHNNPLSGPIPSELASLKSLEDVTSDLIPYTDFSKVRDYITAAQRFYWESPFEGQVAGRELDTLNNLCDRYQSSFAENEGWTNWGSDLPFTSWRGLHVSKAGNIQCLILRGCGLRDEIPAVIANLDKLLYLDLSKNELVGDIPEEFSMLKLLQSLHLDYNNLSGNLNNLTAMRSLKVLDIGHNQLESLPGNMSKLSVLETLRVNNNRLSGK